MNYPTSWAIYVRKSSESEDKQIQSITDQINYLNKIASQFNFKVVATLCDEKSAKAPETRSGFLQLLKLIEQGRIQGILCWKLDRLSRNPIDSAHIQWALQKSQIFCIKTSDREYRPEDNALLYAVEQGMANQYILDLSKNVKRGLLSKAEKGWFPNIPVLGYLNTPHRLKGHKRIIEDPKRFEFVQRLFQLMLTEKYSPMQLHRIATTEWKLDTPKRRRNGKQLISVSHIYKMLGNIFYTGNFYYAGKLYKGNHKAMITISEFEKIQSILKKKSNPRKTQHDFPFTRVIRCSCGAAITATKKWKLVKTIGEFREYNYYHCTRRFSDKVCTEPPITAEELFNQVTEIISRTSINKEFYDFSMEIIKTSEEIEEKHIEAIQSRRSQFVSELEGKLLKLTTYLINGTISETEYLENKTRLENQIKTESLKSDEVAAVPGVANQIMAAFNFSRGGLYALQNGDNSTKHNVLKYFGSNWVLAHKKLCVSTFDWFQKIKDAEISHESILAMFELGKSFIDKPKKANQEIFPLLGAVVEKVRTAIVASEQPFFIPDLSEWVNKLNDAEKNLPENINEF